MAWIIRNAAGEICGNFTNRPGLGNKMPDGSPEVPIYVETNPKEPGYDAAVITEIASFVEAVRVKQTQPLTVAQKLAAVGLTVADLKAELAK